MEIRAVVDVPTSCVPTAVENVGEDESAQDDGNVALAEYILDVEQFLQTVQEVGGDGVYIFYNVAMRSWRN